MQIFKQHLGASPKHWYIFLEYLEIKGLANQFLTAVMKYVSNLKKHCINYSSRSLFEDFEETWSDLNLIQLVECTTWSRIVNNCFKESLLDHIYVTDPTISKSITTVKPCFGDHLLIITELMLNKPPVETTLQPRLKIDHDVYYTSAIVV